MEKKYLIGLDRDGTITSDPGYFGREENWKEKITFCPNALEGLKILKSRPDFKMIVASNQAGVARGFFSIDKMNEINNHIKKSLSSNGIEIKKWYCCPFVDQEYAQQKNIPLDNHWVRETKYRKPKIGMLEMASQDLGIELKDFLGIYFIGDKKTDIETGLNAGGRGILVYQDHSSEEYKLTKELEKENQGRIFFAQDLLEAANLLLKDARLS